MHTPSPQAILFDLGGVIIDIDPERSLRTFEQMGYHDIRPVYATMAEEGWFTRLEIGEAEPVDIYARLRSSLSKEISDEDIRKGWNALLGKLPAERIQLLEQLSDRYRLYLLSNTNPIHMATIHQLVRYDFGVSDMGHWFEQDYYSYEMGLRKPDPTIYQVILDDHLLDPAATLFVDDTPANIESAAQLGFQTLHVPDNRSIVELMKGF